MSDRIRWVGMDIRERTIEMAVLDHNQPDVEAVTVAVNYERPAIGRLMKQLRFDPIVLRTCYEAGPDGFELHRLLAQMDVPCEVVKPSMGYEIAHDGSWPFRRDARRLVAMYRDGCLEPIASPDEGPDSVQDLLRSRDAASRETHMARLQLMQFLLHRGRVFTADGNWTPSHRSWIQQQSFDHPITQAAFDHITTQLHAAENRWAELESVLASLAEEEPHRATVQQVMGRRGDTQMSSLSTN